MKPYSRYSNVVAINTTRINRVNRVTSLLWIARVVNTQLPLHRHPQTYTQTYRDIRRDTTGQRTEEVVRRTISTCRRLLLLRQLTEERLLDCADLQFVTFIVVSMTTLNAGSAIIRPRRTSDTAWTTDVVVWVVFVEWPGAAVWRHLVVIIVSFHQLTNSINVALSRRRRLLINCMRHPSPHTATSRPVHNLSSSHCLFDRLLNKKLNCHKESARQLFSPCLPPKKRNVLCYYCNNTAADAICLHYFKKYPLFVRQYLW